MPATVSVPPVWVAGAAAGASDGTWLCPQAEGLSRACGVWPGTAQEEHGTAIAEGLQHLSRRNLATSDQGNLQFSYMVEVLLEKQDETLYEIH